MIGYGATLTPDDGVLIDISPGAHGNNSLGANDGTGHPLNPVTGQPYGVKLYLALNGAPHDAAICAWGIKGHYDYVRPITAIRRMAELGQSSDPELPAYHPHGLPLQPRLVELITTASATSTSPRMPARSRCWPGAASPRIPIPTAASARCGASDRCPTNATAS